MKFCFGGGPKFLSISFFSGCIMQIVKKIDLARNLIKHDPLSQGNVVCVK